MPCPSETARPIAPLANYSTKLLNQVDGFFYVVMRPVDVLDGTCLQALGKGVVFFFADVMVRLVQQLEGAVQTARPRKAGVNRRMIVDVLAVVDGGFLDFVDGLVDFVDGFLFLVFQFAATRTLEMRARVTQIRERVQIRGMVARRRRFGRECCWNHKQQRKNCSGQLENTFHRLSLSC